MRIAKETRIRRALLNIIAAGIRTSEDRADDDDQDLLVLLDLRRAVDLFPRRSAVEGQST